MTLVTGSLPVFTPGATAVRRDIVNGQVWIAAPYRVLADSGDELVLGCWPGVIGLQPVTYTASLDDARRTGR
jgi:hypothetical protein